MIYNDFQGLKLSALGMGNMRLPVLDGNDNNIDVDAAKEMIAFCMNSGINYYDTAYGYHGGNSELVVGQLLKNYSIWHLSFRDTTSPTCRRSEKSLRNSLRNARWSTLIFTCSTMSAR